MCPHHPRAGLIASYEHVAGELLALELAVRRAAADAADPAALAALRAGLDEHRRRCNGLNRLIVGEP